MLECMVSILNTSGIQYCNEVKCKLGYVTLFILILDIYWICTLKQLQLGFVHFLIATQTIAHSCD